jgi:exodeoxyribonuclease VII small subunit
MKKGKAGDSANTYQTSLKQLENIVQRLEDSETSLEDSLSAFEEGIKLVKEVQTMLREAEQKVTLLTGDGEEPTVEPLLSGEE